MDRSFTFALMVVAQLGGAGCGAEDGSSVSSASSGGPSELPVQGTCAVCDPPTNKGPVKNVSLVETSGIAASAVHQDVIYAQNDSGDSSRFFALSLSGDDLGTFNVTGAKNDDWEDMARGPCVAGSCLFIGDTGDNVLERPSYAVYRIIEPASIKAGEQSIASEKLEFTYADGPHDAEVLLVHPITGVVSIITKVESGPASIYELPLPLSVGQTFTAVKVGEVQPPKGHNELRGGSIHPDATGILLRTRTSLFYYPMKPEQTAAEALAFGACPLLVAEESQGEAVTWLSSGTEIMTIGEGAAAQVRVSKCDL